MPLPNSDSGNNVILYSPPMEICCRGIELLLMIKGDNIPCLFCNCAII